MQAYWTLIRLLSVWAQLYEGSSLQTGGLFNSHLLPQLYTETKLPLCQLNGVTL